MGSYETSWKAGPPRTLTSSEFEKLKLLTSSFESPTPVSPSPPPTFVISPDDSINDEDDIIDLCTSSSDDQDEEEILEDVSSGLSSDQDEVESVSDKDENFITIEDDDDDNDDGDTLNTPWKERVCYRCPSKTQGIFRNVKLYFAHVKRHVLPDLFACPVCKRTFLKFSHCLSHEIRVHRSPLECSINAIKDASAVVQAKQYMKSRKAKQTGCSRPSQEIGVTGDDEDTDPEDTTFYDNRFIKSGAFYPYRGPPVTSIIQCYEIQLINPNRKGIVNNDVAQEAIDIHKYNVKNKMDTNRLGNFAQKKKRNAKRGMIRRKAPQQASDKSVREGKRCRGNSSSPSSQPVRKKLRSDGGNLTDKKE